MPASTKPSTYWTGFATQQNAEEVAKVIQEVLGSGAFTIVELTNGLLSNISTSQHLAKPGKYVEDVIAADFGEGTAKTVHLLIGCTNGTYVFNAAPREGEEVEDIRRCTRIVIAPDRVDLLTGSDSGEPLRRVFVKQ
jgi:hypothetical protein